MMRMVGTGWKPISINTKLDEKEGDEALKIRLRPASGAKLLMYRLTLIVVLVFLNESASRFRQSRSQAPSDVRNASRIRVGTRST